MSNDPGRVATNLRTLLIIEALASRRQALTPAGINAHVGLPKASIHRLCQTLVREGFLVQDTDSARLRPGRRLAAIASGLLGATHEDVARHQVLQWVSRHIGETVNFVMPEATGMTYRDRVETAWPLRIQLPIGSSVPFHCTASGKTFLASLPRRRRNALVRALALERHAGNTITDADRLLDALAEVASRGHAVDDQEFVDGMVAVAVPVLDPDSHFVAALAFHAPMQRMDLDAALAQLPVLTEGAARLRAMFFGDDDA